MTSVHSDRHKSKLEPAISYLLIGGVAFSLLCEAIGIVLLHHSSGRFGISESREMFIRGQNFFSFLYGLFHGEYRQNSGVLLMTLGIAILILTPYARVVMSVFYFAWKKNIKYVVITLFVLILLTISLAIH